MIALTLPWPPSVNHLWRFVPFRGGVRVLMSREGRAYRRQVCALLASRHQRPLDGRLQVRVVLHPPTRRSLDIDNRIKSLVDAMQHARVFLDDNQIDRLEIERGEIVSCGRAIVEIEELPG